MAVVYGPHGTGLRTWTYQDLMTTVLTDRQTTIQWCKDTGLLAKEMKCPGCNTQMRWEVTPEMRTDGCRYTILCYNLPIIINRWRCPVRGCRKKRTIRYDSWFSGHHLTIPQVLQIMYLWSEDISQEMVKRWVGVADHTIVDWFNYLREASIVITKRATPSVAVQSVLGDWRQVGRTGDNSWNQRGQIWPKKVPQRMISGWTLGIRWCREGHRQGVLVHCTL